MSATLQPSRLLFAAAMIALGVTGLVNGDFALVWQNVPAHLPGRTIVAYVCAVIELVAGVGLLFEHTLAVACRVLFPYMVLWVVLLKIPGVVHAPLGATAWGGIGEIGTMLAGAWCLFAAHAGSRETRRPGFPLLGGRSSYRSHRNHRIHHYIPGRRAGVGGGGNVPGRAMVRHRAPGLEGLTRAVIATTVHRNMHRLDLACCSDGNMIGTARGHIEAARWRQQADG